MKILFLNYEYPPLGGGAGNATKYILREFSRMPQIEVHLVTASLNGETTIEVDGDNISIHRVAIGKKGENLTYQTQADILSFTWKGYEYAKRLFSVHNFDIIHAFFSVPCGYQAKLLSKKFDIPYIVSLRGSDVPGYSERFTYLYPLVNPFIFSSWKHASRVIANSKGLKNLAKESKPNQKIEVIYNGIDGERFEYVSREAERKKVRLLCASRLSKRKGFRFAVEAFFLLREKYNNIELILAGGEGNAERELRDLVQEKNLRDSVHFTGSYTQNELIELQEKADIFLFPSLNEGMSNSLLEAMSSGLPVIVTPTGGADELVENGENGFLVKFSDAKDIAEKTEKLIEDKDLRLHMGKRSREITEDLSWRAAANAYKNTYEAIVEK